MNLRQYFFMFRVRWKLALGLMLGTVAIAVPVIVTLPKQYTASTSLGVETKSPDMHITIGWTEEAGRRMCRIARAMPADV